MGLGVTHVFIPYIADEYDLQYHETTNLCKMRKAQTFSNLKCLAKKKMCSIGGHKVNF